MLSMKLADVLDELVEKRDIDRGVLANIVNEGILAAYQKKYPDIPLFVECNPHTGAVTILAEMKVVPAVSDELREISLRRARLIDDQVGLDSTIRVPFAGTIGRIEIARARQVIANMIRVVEAQAVYDSFKGREGTIVYCIIHKCSRGGMIVKIDDALAFLPKSLSIPTDRCVVGMSIRALLKEVLPEPRNDNQLILDRASEQFVRQLFEIEIPEIFERIVEIKKIVRVAGYKTKIAVQSNEENIDPVGTCVGLKGGRIRPILKELGDGEKIDIIPYSNSLESFVRDALKPAQVNRVEIEGNVALVWVDEEQRSLAIGRGGQNIQLASRLAGVEIRLASGARGIIDGDEMIEDDKNNSATIEVE